MLTKNTQIMVVVFLVLLLGFLGYQRYQEANPPEEEVELVETDLITPAFSFSVDQIGIITVQNLDGGMVAMSQAENGVWSLSVPPTPAELTDQQAIFGALSQLVSMTQTDTGGDILSSLGALGLDFPGYIIAINLTDGSTHLVKVGIENVTGSGYYVQVDSDTPILVQKLFLSQLLSMIDSPPMLQPSEDVQ
jgi:hypothetical protein